MSYHNCESSLLDRDELRIGIQDDIGQICMLDIGKSENSKIVPG